MATNTYTAIATQTLASAASSVTFNSIPSGYTDLQIVISATASGLVNGRLQVNGDTSSGLYSTTVLYGTGSSAASTRQSGQNSIWLDNTDTGSSVNTTIISLMNYSNATTYKTCLIRGSAASTQVDAHVGLWRNTNPITSITLFPSSGTYSTGSTFNLYGIAASSVGAYATGGTIYSDSTYWYHVFAANGTFTPTQALTADVLVVAGGGGGANNIGGGGGAGGVRYGASQSLSSGVAYTCTVGGGGAGAYTSGGTQTIGNKGTNSSITGSGFTTFSATGGGYGANGDNNGGAGGSGGGTRASVANGGAGNEGGYTPVEGYAGGKGSAGTNSGGGGGAGGVGANGTSGQSGQGGIGTNTYSSWLSVTGLGVSGYIAGGGGGGGYSVTSVLAGSGGLGGGGNGTYTPAGANGGNGTANTGSGGGGAADVTGAAQSAGAGGSGLIIVRYAK